MNDTEGEEDAGTAEEAAIGLRSKRPVTFSGIFFDDAGRMVIFPGRVCGQGYLLVDARRLFPGRLRIYAILLGTLAVALTAFFERHFFFERGLLFTTGAWVTFTCATRLVAWSHLRSIARDCPPHPMRVSLTAAVFRDADIPLRQRWLALVWPAVLFVNVYVHPHFRVSHAFILLLCVEFFLTSTLWPIYVRSVGLRRRASEKALVIYPWAVAASGLLCWLFTLFGLAVKLL